LPDAPYWTPYLTTYYNKNWGFCLPDLQKKQLPDGDYRVLIDSSFSDGHLPLTHAVIDGANTSEIFFSSYLCHPSMANNELSGPVVLAGVLNYLLEKYPNPKFTYRFVLLPETIGSIAYLSTYGSHLKTQCIA